MSIIAFLSEPFVKQNGRYVSNKASINFIKSCFNEKIITVGRVINCKIATPSATVDVDSFEECPNYDSIVDFFKRSFSNPLFIINYIKVCFNILERHPGKEVWVRNPSIGCLIFSLCALKRNRKVYNHMCANAMNAWDSPKYKGGIRFFAYVFSLFLKMLVNKVVSHRNTINLCTGDELLDFCIRKNKNSHLLIDSNIKNVTLPTSNLNAEIFKFLFVGRVQEDKGVLELIEAFSKLENNNYRLDIIGDGPLLNVLKSECSDRRIDFLGQIPNNLLPEYFSRSSVLVVPSKNRYEGFPRVILEAWSNGLPVIVSNVGGVKSFVVDGENGFLINLGSVDELCDAMKKVTRGSNLIKLRDEVRKNTDITTEAYWVSKFREIRL